MKPLEQKTSKKREQETRKNFGGQSSVSSTEMTPSEEFYQGLVCGVVIGLFILWLQTDASRDRNNHNKNKGKRKGDQKRTTISVLKKVSLM